MALLDALVGTLANIKANNFLSVIVGDVHTKVFINIMHQSQAVGEIGKAGDPLCDVDAKTSADTLADGRQSMRDTDRFEEHITFLKAGCFAGKGKSQDCIRHAIKGGGQDNSRDTNQRE